LKSLKDLEKTILASNYKVFSLKKTSKLALCNKSYTFLLFAVEENIGFEKRM
jgi:hypothetical protein